MMIKWHETSETTKVKRLSSLTWHLISELLKMIRPLRVKLTGEKVNIRCWRSGPKSALAPIPAVDSTPLQEHFTWDIFLGTVYHRFEWKQNWSQDAFRYEEARYLRIPWMLLWILTGINEVSSNAILIAIGTLITELYALTSNKLRLHIFRKTAILRTMFDGIKLRNSRSSKY